MKLRNALVLTRKLLEIGRLVSQIEAYDTYLTYAMYIHIRLRVLAGGSTENSVMPHESMFKIRILAEDHKKTDEKGWSHYEVYTKADVIEMMLIHIPVCPLLLSAFTRFRTFGRG